jgi:BlaI family transcriptional regulator, penicillinase repressor
MKKGKIHRLGDLQLRIMKILWAREEATVAEVFEELGKGADLAYTTVATMLRKMEERGLIAHRTDGRAFVYRARVASEAVSRSMIDHLVDRMFEGNLTAAVNHLLTTREVSREELKALERLIAQRKKGK